MDKIQIEARLEEMPKEIQQEMRMIRQNSDDSGRSLPYKYEIKNGAIFRNETKPVETDNSVSKTIDNLKCVPLKMDNDQNYSVKPIQIKGIRLNQKYGGEEEDSED